MATHQTPVKAVVIAKKMGPAANLVMIASLALMSMTGVVDVLDMGRTFLVVASLGVLIQDSVKSETNQNG